jgi:peptidoglycan/LPS O-acetylase OafA/YrhL
VRRHIAALDGLRGAAVCGVLAFHLGDLQGGYLGVDLFFVLSGYLITSLMLGESAKKGRIDLGAFWARRARRLLPALFLVVGAVAVYAAGEPQGVALGALRGDALATLGYIANWHSLWSDTSYWELFSAPSLLAHTWSLAIEEQLYVLWPLVVVGVLRAGRRRLQPLFVTTLVLAATSWIVMALVHVGGGDTARAYFGTDTRAGAVLIGAALATWIAWRGPIRSSAVHAAGIVGAVVLAVAWTTVEGTTGWLYEGGFALLGIAAIAVIASISEDDGPLARALSLRPLRHLGTISYGIYLWHWPIFVVLDEQSDVVKLAVTLVVSELSFRLVEWPIRRGSLRGWRIRLATPAAAASVVVAIVAATAVAPGPSAVASSVVPPPAESPPTTGAPVAPPIAGTTRVLVVGDSGGWFMGDALTRVGAEHDVEVRNAGTVGCGVATIGGRLKVGEGEYFVDADWCQDWPNRWTGELQAFQPDVALLVIAWPGLGDRMIEDEWRAPCDPVYDEYYAGQVRQAIEVLGRTGSSVVVADSPYLWLPVGSDADRRVDCLNEIYHREVDALGATLLPLLEWTCPDGPDGCVDEIDGVKLRYDGIHFQDEGADIAATWVAPRLRAIASAGTEQEQDAEEGERAG